VNAPIDTARLREEILAWMSPPPGDAGGRIAGRQIRRLIEALEHPSAREDAFLAAVAEAELARRLLVHGCSLAVEAPTAGGKHADFLVTHGDSRLYLHVKRLGVGVPAESTLPAELHALESITRPVAVVVRAAPLDGARTARLAAALEPFVREASVGEEIAVRDEDGTWLGAARIAAPVAGTHCVLRGGPDAERDGAVPRVQRLLRKACTQFMPGATNVICIASDSDAGAEAVDTALLGSFIERWDAFPPRGQRVAHGRADDGFWAGGHFPESTVVCWMPVRRGSPGRVWVRPGARPAAERAAALVRDALR
jgi:hypothetical protein